MPIRLPLFVVPAVCFALFSLAACGKSDNNVVNAASAPPPVSVVELQPRTVPMFAEYAAQTFARDAVEIRGQVDGYIRKRLFQTGSAAKAGAVLYAADLRPS